MSGFMRARGAPRREAFFEFERICRLRIATKGSIETTRRRLRTIMDTGGPDNIAVASRGPIRLQRRPLITMPFDSTAIVAAGGRRNPGGLEQTPTRIQPRVPGPDAPAGNARRRSALSAGRRSARSSQQSGEYIGTGFMAGTENVIGRRRSPSCWRHGPTDKPASPRPIAVQRARHKAGRVRTSPAFAWGGSYGGTRSALSVINLLKANGIRGTFCVAAAVPRSPPRRWRR